MLDTFIWKGKESIICNYQEGTLVGKRSVALMWGSLMVVNKKYHEWEETLQMWLYHSDSEGVAYLEPYVG